MSTQAQRTPLRKKSAAGSPFSTTALPACPSASSPASARRRSPRRGLIQFNHPLAAELGLETAALGPDGLAAIFSGNVTPPGAEPIALAYAGHQFASFVPQLGDGRAILIGEVVDRAGAASRHPAERLGPDAVLPPRRRTRSARAGPARISGQRGDACARRPDDAGACGRLDRRARLSRRAPSRRDIDPRRRKPPAGRDLPVFRCAPRHRRAQTSCRLYDRSPRSGGKRGRASVSGSAAGGRGTSGAADRALDAARLHPWRDEHGQYRAVRRDDRFRTLRLHGRLRSRDRVQRDRPVTGAMPTPISRQSRHGTWRGSPRPCFP